MRTRFAAASVWARTVKSIDVVLASFSTKSPKVRPSASTPRLALMSLARFNLKSSTRWEIQEYGTLTSTEKVVCRVRGEQLLALGPTSERTGKTQRPV